MTIAEAIKALADLGNEIYCKICKVDEVDEDKRVCDVSPIDGSAPILDVKLQANQESKHGVVVFPKVGSYVVVGFINNAAGVLLMTDEIDKIEVAIEETTIVVDKDGVVFNGGDNDGMVKINELTDKLNGLTDTVDALVKNFNGHTHSGTDSLKGAVSTIATLSQATEPAKFSAKEYINDKVKH